LIARPYRRSVPPHGAGMARLQFQKALPGVDPWGGFGTCYPVPAGRAVL